MPPPLLSLRNIQLTFGGTPLLEGADMSVFEGERLCVVGRNGSGKSTLLKIAAGMIESDKGERVVRSGTVIRYLAQEPDLTGFTTTLAYAEAGLTDPNESYRAQSALNALGLTGEEGTERLSGGEAKRAAIAQALAAQPDILLLDEPTNHLDLPAIEFLETELKSQRCAIVLISHDRRFLQNLTRSTLWVDRGITRSLSRGFKDFEAWRDDVLAEEEADRHKLDRKIAREVDWMHYGGVTARRRRNMGRVRALAGLREAKVNDRQSLGKVKMTVTEGQISGKLVIEAKEISKSFGAQTIVDRFSIRIDRGDRIGIVGPNGAGKTTLINMLTGALAPDHGTIRLGANLQMITADQKRESLPPETGLAEVLTGGRGDHVFVGGKSKHVVSYMKDFLFTSEQARTPVRALSGGERGRLMLALALAKPSNVLVLDEPTNDLDIETLDLLQEMIGDYQGTVLLVSHDRDFLDRTVTSIILAEGEGRWVDYAGGYSDMVAQRGRGVDAKAAAANGGSAGSSHAAVASNPSAPARRKLSFKEKHALETLPKDITQLEAERADIQQRLTGPASFAKSPEAFRQATARLAAIETTLATYEEEWLRLELLREQLAG